VVIKAASDIGFPLHQEGTCVAIEGPRFSSRAEVGTIFNIHFVLKIVNIKYYMLSIILLKVQSEFEIRNYMLNKR
jgi:hypothetical protein